MAARPRLEDRMSPRRRLHGIAALSAGALAVGLTVPAGAADAPGEEPALDPAAAAASEAALREWEAVRGVDVPDDLFVKLGDLSDDTEVEGDFWKVEYRPGTETTDAAIIKYDYGAVAPDSAFLKVTYSLDDPQAADLVDGLDELFPKVEDPGLDISSEDLFLKLGELQGTQWAYQPADRPTDDAFIKIESTADDDAPALVTWQYDALDLVEQSLIERAEAVESDGDPDRPIADVLTDVRDLRGAGPVVNPFVERDRSMKSLPLPKKLPADAGTYAVPKAGRWRAVNLPGTLSCGGFTSRIRRSATDKATIEIQNGGQRLVGRELGEKGSKFVVEADPKVTGRYTGTVNLKADGGRVDMDLTMQLITDKHIVGTADVTVRAGGQRCKIKRGFDVKYRGK